MSKIFPGRKQASFRVYCLLQVGKCFTVPVNPLYATVLPYITMDNDLVIASFTDRG